MQSHPQPAPTAAQAPGRPSATAHRFEVSEIKARAKAIKKQRKQEGRTFFMSWCSCLHALGFSF